ncbi:MAG: TspO/MBR family protein [Steroidobacteraceae bacterium]
MKHKDGLSLIIILSATVLVAGLGSIASINAVEFYAQLTQPAFAPPASVFGPAWTTLFVLMTISAWLVVRERGWRGSRVEMWVYLVQLLLNALWSWLFFHWHLGMAALIEVVVLWVAILITCVVFWRIKVLAGVLLIPYLLWVGFATALTYAMVSLNPQSL